MKLVFDYVGGYSFPYVGVNPNECKILLPVFEGALKDVQKKYEKYLDIRDAGDTTERQLDLLLKYQEQFENLSSLIESCKEIK